MKKTAQFTKRGPLALAAFALGESYEVETDRAISDAGPTIKVVDIKDCLAFEPHPDFDDYASIQCRIYEAMETAQTVILRIHSPGGDVYGAFETAHAIKLEAEARGVQLIAFVNGICASAAYAFACACSSIVTTPTGLIGSIGVINQLSSRAAADKAAGIEYLIVTSGAHKADGNPHVVISDATREDQQQQVDSLAEIFYDLVSESRGMSLEKVKALEARVFHGQNAVAQGLADQVATWDELLVMTTSLTGVGSTQPKANSTMDNMKDLLAALQAMADGDGEDSDKAKQMLKMLAAAADDDKPADDSPAAEDDAPPAKDDDKPEPEAEDDAPAPADDDKKGAAKASLDLFKAYATLAAKVENLATKDERRTLLASRPDIMKDKNMKAWLEKAPLATVRNALKAIPKAAATTNLATKAAAAIQANVKATRGETQKSGDRLPPEEAKKLDERMGFVKPQASSVKREGSKLVFHIGSGQPSKTDQSH